MNRITVIVPIYNIDAKHLRMCIESIIEQTLKEIEIILVDDGSTKENAMICDEYSKIDNRIKVIHKKNAGVSAARNEGVRQSTTKYIMFVDGDDWIEKECCQTAYNYMIQNSKVELVCFNYYKKYRDKEEKIKIFNNKKLINCQEKKKNYYDMKILGSTCMKLYAKKIIENQYFNETLTNGEDVEFNFRVFKNIKYIFCIDESFYHYRIQNESSVRKYNVDMIENYEKTLKAMKIDLCQDEEIMRINAYYSFGAVAYLLICLNGIFSVENKISYLKKIEQIKELSKKDLFKEILEKSNKVKLPITRKLPLILAKYHLYYGLNIMIKIKRMLMSR